MKNNNSLKNIKVYGRKIRQKWENLSLKQRIVALAMAGSFMFTGGLAAYSAHEASVNSTSLSYVDLDDDKEKDVKLYDENGKEIKIHFSDMSKVHAIVNRNQETSNDKLEVTLVDESGKMKRGYIDSEYLANNNIQRLNISKAPFNDSSEELDDFNEVCVVSAKSGAWLRPNMIVDRNSDEPIFLEPGTYVLSDSSSIISAENEYSWRKCIVKKGNELKMGYIADDYLISADFNNIEGMSFKVNSKDGLRLRKASSTKSDVITKLKNNEKVILIPNLETYSDDKYDWFYVAVKRDDEIILGYVAATEYKKDGTVRNYLWTDEMKEKQKEIERQKEEERLEQERIANEKNKTSVVKIVDTKNKKITLKLREKPSTKAKIVAKIQTGTLINTTEEAYNEALKSEKVDGYRWLKIKLVTGEEGYVAIEYLKEYVQKNKKYNLINAKFEGKDYKGYFGIDIRSGGTTPDDIRKILTEDHIYPVEDQFAKGTVLKRPDYIIFRLGATGMSQNRFCFATDAKAYYKHVLSLAMECEKNGTPYGFYYFSQAITKEEADKEIKYIVDFFKSVGPSLKYNVIPFGFDAEFGSYEDENGKSYKSRNKVFAEKKNGKNAYTSVVNYGVNKLREELKKYGIKNVIIYTDHRTLTGGIDYKKLDKKNQDELWLVDVNPAHEKELKKTYSYLLPNIVIRQTKGTTKIRDNKNNVIIKVDYNFANEDKFNEWTKDLQKSSGAKSGGQEVSENKVFGIYPGSIMNVQAVNNYNAIELCECITKLSEKINNETDDENVSIEEVLEDQYALEYLIYQTRKFDVNLPAPASGKHIEVNDSFNNWYIRWSTYVNYLNENISSFSGENYQKVLK